ncbi:hypothetical protein [Actinobacillus pleuropneumoniae]
MKNKLTTSYLNEIKQIFTFRSSASLCGGKFRYGGSLLENR